MSNACNLDDDSAEEKYRVYAILSFAVILFGVGLPVWWYTTAVPRVTLPYSGIAALGDLETRIQIRLVVAATSRERAATLSHELSVNFGDVEMYTLNITHTVLPKDVITSVHTIHELDDISSSFDLHIGDLLLFEAPNLNDGIVIGSKRAVYFSDITTAKQLAEVLSDVILRDKSLALTKNTLAEPTKYSLDEENRRRFPSSPAYDILLTVVNPNPEQLQVDWSLQHVADAYIQPFLDYLTPIANYSIKSQWLYFLPLDVIPKKVADDSAWVHHYALPEEVLPQLITPLEKKLASQVSSHPCINLVVYMVPCEDAPLYIYDRKGHRSYEFGDIQAFHSPRWGGVVIMNPPIEVCKSNNHGVAIMKPDEKSIIGIFLSQLRLLLGIPEMVSKSGVIFLSPTELKPRDWELDALLRVRAVEQLTSAKLTLQSLAQLLEEIGNIVITDTVGNRIKDTLHLVEQSAELLKNGDLEHGFLTSKEAFVNAEAAFTDPSLLALLYFPDDQKYAVYVPLFLPVMMPVLFLLFKKLHKYYFGTKETAKDEDAKGK